MAFLPMMANAYDAEINGIYYNLNIHEHTAEVTSSTTFSANYSGDIIIPNKVKYEGQEYAVTSIGYGSFGNCDNLTSVIIPNSVITIEMAAFYGCI